MHFLCRINIFGIGCANGKGILNSPIKNSPLLFFSPNQKEIPFCAPPTGFSIVPHFTYLLSVPVVLFMSKYLHPSYTTSSSSTDYGRQSVFFFLMLLFSNFLFLYCISNAIFIIEIFEITDQAKIKNTRVSM